MAEKELAEFRSAVNEFFGSDRVQQAIENWMAKLQAMDWPLDGRVKGWRQLTRGGCSYSRISIDPQRSSGATGLG